MRLRPAASAVFVRRAPPAISGFGGKAHKAQGSRCSAGRAPSGGTSGGADSKSAFPVVSAAALSALLALSPSVAAEAKRRDTAWDDEEDEDFDAPFPRASPFGTCGDGVRVFVWGQRAAIPVCEVSGDAPPEGDRNNPTEVVWFREEAERRGHQWRQVAFGPSFGVARTDAGELYVWGSERNGSSARRFARPRRLVTDAFGPGGDACQAGFTDVQCSESAVWALTADGAVIVWERVVQLITGSASSDASAEPAPLCGGRLLGGLDKRPVTKMSVGATHAAFVTEDGNLYCLGSNACGECGADPTKYAVAATVRRVQFPRHTLPIQWVHCGRSHTVVVGAEGQGLAWGDDSKIQLGLGDTRSNLGDERPWTGSRGYLNLVHGGEGMAPSGALRGGPDAVSFNRAPSTASKKYGEFEAHLQWRPSLMMDIPLEFERQAHGTPYPPPDGLLGGDDFTMLVVRDSPDWFPPEEESNRLFCCGENGKGQCGRSLQSTQQIFAATKLPRCSRAFHASCGSSHCLALLRRARSRKTEMWCWGSNDHGQVGGSKSIVCPAARLRLPRDARPEAVWCGFGNSSVICNTRPPKVQAEQVSGASPTAGQDTI